MNKARKLSARLTAERLEDRITPAGNLAWPIADADIQGVLSTYGQFMEGGGIHLHEGLDILAGQDKPVTAVENGQYLNGSRLGQSDDYVAESVTTVDAADHGWSYVHATANANFMLRDPLSGQIANVSPPPGTYDPHLHLNYTAPTADPNFPTTLRPAGNALDYLVSKDALAPTVVADGFRFRTAAADSGAASANVNADHFYFQPFNPAGLNIPYVGANAPTRDGGNTVGTGSAAVDAMSNVYDQMAVNGRHLAPYSVTFRIQGDAAWNQNDDTGWVTPFKFTASFAGNQGYTAYFNIPNTRTVYEYDTQAQSTEGQDYYYILTNYNGNAIVDSVDRARSWQSNVSRTSGKQWYDSLVAADLATVNSNSQFRDGFYRLTVKAKDASDNESAAVSQRFLLSNFQRPLTAAAPGNGTIRFDANPNYLANDAVPIYELMSTPQEGTALTNQIGTVATDANGTMIPKTFDFIPGRVYVADYDHDGVYYSPLDTIALLHRLQAPSVGHSSTGGTLTARQVDSLLPEAIHRWQSAGVDTSVLAGVDVRIADLGGTTLGLAVGRTITLDDNAAGWGWFVDATPSGDSEFTTPGNQGERNRMDLLTVIEHELGHLLGKEHEETGVMIDTLPAGTRRNPGSDLSLSDFTNSDWFSAWSEWELSSLRKTRTHQSTF